MTPRSSPRFTEHSQNPSLLLTVAYVGIMAAFDCAVWKAMQLFLLQLFSWSTDVNWPSFGKVENKSQLTDIVSQDNVSIYWYDIAILQTFTHQKHQNRTIKTTISQQYTSFVFPFVETRSVDETSVDRENAICTTAPLLRFDWRPSLSIVHHNIWGSTRLRAKPSAFLPGHTLDTRKMCL